MATIPGASQFLNSATLANTQGRSATQSTVLGDGGTGTVSLLDAGRISTGIGLSARARQQTESFLSTTASSFNQIHSLAIGATSSPEALTQTILALRARLPDSSIHPSALGQEVDEKA